MKKVLSIALLFNFLATGVVCANADSVERGYVSTSISKEMEIAPDVAEISFAVKTFDNKSMQKASAVNKEITDRLYSDLSSMLNSANGDYIKTSNYTATPVYIYTGNKKILDKYEVSNRVTVHTKNIKNLGLIIDSALDAGALNVDSLTFSISNYENQCNELIEKGVKEARYRAEIAAKSTSTILTGVRNLDVSCHANNYNSPRMYMAKNMLSSAAEDTAGAGSTTISGGVIKINANVNACYFVK